MLALPPSRRGPLPTRIARPRYHRRSPGPVKALERADQIAEQPVRVARRALEPGDQGVDRRPVALADRGDRPERRRGRLEVFFGAVDRTPVQGALTRSSGTGPTPDRADRPEQEPAPQGPGRDLDRATDQLERLIGRQVAHSACGEEVRPAGRPAPARRGPRASRRDSFDSSPGRPADGQARPRPQPNRASLFPGGRKARRAARPRLLLPGAGPHRMPRPSDPAPPT